MPVFNWTGPFIVFLGIALYMLGTYQSVATTWELGSLLFVIGCVISVAGTDLLKRFLPAFFVLGFIIPVPTPIANQIVEPLQAVTTDITQVLYSLIGLDIEREGNYMINSKGQIILLSQTGKVMGLFMAYVIMSYAFAFGMPLRPLFRAFLLVISPIAALFANIIRSLSTVWMYSVFQPAMAFEIMKYVAGISLVLAIIILYLIIRLLLWTSLPIHRFSIPKEG